MGNWNGRRRTNKNWIIYVIAGLFILIVIGFIIKKVKDKNDKGNGNKVPETSSPNISSFNNTNNNQPVNDSSKIEDVEKLGI